MVNTHYKVYIQINEVLEKKYLSLPAHPSHEEVRSRMKACPVDNLEANVSK